MSIALEADLERACRLLESATPQAMDESAAMLEDVVRDLTARRALIGVEEARRLRNAARKARMLLELAARFHSRWHDILGGMTGGYTAQGSAAALSRRGRLSVSG
jgi:hypothetical protein